MKKLYGLVALGLGVVLLQGCGTAPATDAQKRITRNYIAAIDGGWQRAAGLSGECVGYETGAVETYAEQYRQLMVSVDRCQYESELHQLAKAAMEAAREFHTVHAEMHHRPLQGPPSYTLQDRFEEEARYEKYVAQFK